MNKHLRLRIAEMSKLPLTSYACLADFKELPISSSIFTSTPIPDISLTDAHQLDSAEKSREEIIIPSHFQIVLLTAHCRAEQQLKSY